jgi:hypothetical protein
VTADGANDDALLGGRACHCLLSHFVRGVLVAAIQRWTSWFRSLRYSPLRSALVRNDARKLNISNLSKAHNAVEELAEAALS